MASLAELKERAKARTAANKAAAKESATETTTTAPPTAGSKGKPEAVRASKKLEIPHPSGDTRFKLVDRTLQRFQYQQDALIEVLHTAQEAFGFLEDDLLIYVARQLKLPFSWVYGVATFYHFFSLKPQGEHSCVVCLGTACYVKRAAEIVAALRAEFGIEPGQTTPDNRLSISAARCLGSCGLAPVLVLDGKVLGREVPESVVEQVRARLHQTRAAEPDTETASFEQRQPETASFEQRQRETASFEQRQREKEEVHESA